MERQLAREFARTMGREATDAERRLWARLRAQQSGFKFRRQHPIAGFVVDFCCIGRRLVVELDGGQHQLNAEYDAARSRALTQRGYRIIRFWDSDALLNIEGVLEEIMRALKE